MPKRVQLKEAAEAGAANGHSVNGTTAATSVMVPPPPASSEARGNGGDAPWSPLPHDAPPSLYVARRVRAIAEGEEWPPANASPAWLAGRESAIAGDPVEFNPHAREEDTSGEEQQMAAEWNDGWQCGTAEANATAANEPTVEGGDPLDRNRLEYAPGQPKQHPEGKWELYQGIPGKDDFSDLDQEYLDAPALSRMGGELIERCEELKHLRGLDIRYFWKARGGAPNNKVRLGRSYQPDGLERQSLDFPVWVIWLASDNLRTLGASKLQIEAALYRQLKHCQRTNAGKPTHAPYDFEGFQDELKRYGPWNRDFVLLAEAIGKTLGPEVVQGALDLRPPKPVKEVEADEDEDADDEDGD